MTKIEKVLAGTILLSLAWPATAAPQPGGAEEEIVFIRHGEKPNAGLGQLDCRGLNRSLALPKAIIAAVGRPDAIWAANPSQQKDDRGVAYDYVRPLATIEPTAIALAGHFFASFPSHLSSGHFFEPAETRAAQFAESRLISTSLS